MTSDTVKAENDALRQIVCDCAKAIGNGAALSSDCSVEFMSFVPGEIALHIAKLKEANTRTNTPPDPEMVEENKALRHIIAELGYCTPDASLEFMRMIPAEVRAAIAAMGTIASDGGEVDVERLWSALAGHQSDDRTWLQIGKSDFVRAIAAINSQQREGNGE
jgi:hypothetical protein